MGIKHFHPVLTTQNAVFLLSVPLYKGMTDEQVVLLLH
jgi:hypothetical protein